MYTILLLIQKDYKNYVILLCYKKENNNIFFLKVLKIYVKAEFKIIQICLKDLFKKCCYIFTLILLIIMNYL